MTLGRLNVLRSKVGRAFSKPLAIKLYYLKTIPIGNPG